MKNGCVDNNGWLYVNFEEMCILVGMLVNDLNNFVLIRLV